MYIHFSSYCLSSGSVILLMVWNLFGTRPSETRSLVPPCDWWQGTEGIGAGQRLPFSHLPAGPIPVGHSTTDQPCQQEGKPPPPQCACSPRPQYRCLAINSRSNRRRHFEEDIKSTVFNSRLRPASSLCGEHQLVLSCAGSEVGSASNSSTSYCYRWGLVYAQRI